MTEETLIEKIQKEFDKHIDVVDAIMAESIEPGLTVEVKAACDNFTIILSDLEDGENFDDLLKKLDATELTNAQFGKLAKTIVDHDEFDLNIMLSKIEDQSEIADFLSDQSYVCVKLENMNQMEKLREFITTEIFPHYSDQMSFLKCSNI